MPEERRETRIAAHSRPGSMRVVLHRLEERAAEALADARRELADDRADDRGRGGDLERREQVRRRRRQPELPQDRPSRGAAYERISSNARGSAARRPRIAAIVTGKKVR